MITAMLQNKLHKGIAIMLFSSLMTCTGQLCWKLSADYSILFLPAGFGMYGLGALLMIVALWGLIKTASAAQRRIYLVCCPGSSNFG